MAQVNRWRLWIGRVLSGWGAATDADPQAADSAPLDDAHELATTTDYGSLRSATEPHFDRAFYLATYLDVRTSGIDPLDHYLRYGWREGRKPREDFDTAFYLAHNDDVRQSGINPFYHYLSFGRAQGRQATRAVDDFERRIIGAQFERDHYLNMYEDVRRAGVDPLDHFILMGWRERRNPSKDFDTEFYLATNDDVRSADINPFYHYLVAGKAEGRAPKRPETAVDEHPQSEAALAYARQVLEPHFDRDFYLEQNNDVRDANVDPLVHYLTEGWREGRNPCWSFDTKFYLDSYEDIKKAGVNPYFHYIVAGREEGRLAKDQLSVEISVLRNTLGGDARARQWIRSENPIALSESSLRALMKSKMLRAATGNCLSVSQDNYMRVTGGIQACLVDEQRLFKKLGYNYFHIFPVQPLPTLYEEPDAAGVLVHLTVNGNVLGSASAATVSALLAPIFSRTKRPVGSRSDVPGRLMILHSLLGHSVEALLALAKSLKVEHSYFWLHDYFSLCESYTLLRNDLTFCGAPKSTSQACLVCSHGASRSKHQERIGRLFAQLRPTLIAPSRAALAVWGNSPLKRHVTARIVLPHCQLVPIVQKGKRRAKTTNPEVNRPLRIGFLGYDLYHKGWSVFERLAHAFSADARYRFYHLGNRRIRNPFIAFVRVDAGSDNRDAMIKAVREHSLDVVIIWPKWPETFSFVTLEAVAAGALVVTNSSSGNVAKLVSQYSAGCVVENEAALDKFFSTGEVIELFSKYADAATEWAPRLEYSGCTASLIASRLPLGMHHSTNVRRRSDRARDAGRVTHNQDTTPRS